jgi:hypothetical protein
VSSDFANSQVGHSGRRKTKSESPRVDSTVVCTCMPHDTMTLRFTFTGVRGTLSGGPFTALQLAEIHLFGASGKQIHPLRASNPSGRQPSRCRHCASQSADQVMDGDLGTKWVDLNFNSSVSSVLLLELDDANVASYQLFTANDVPRRDPLAWEVDMLRSGQSDQEWVRVDARRTMPPAARRAPYDRFKLQKAVVTRPATSAAVAPHCPSHFLLLGSTPEQLGSSAGYVLQLAKLAAYANRSFVLPHIRPSFGSAEGSPCRGQHGCNSGAFSALPEANAARFDELFEPRDMLGELRQVHDGAAGQGVVSFEKWAACSGRAVDAALHFAFKQGNCSERVAPTLRSWSKSGAGVVLAVRCVPARLREARLRTALQPAAGRSLLVVSWPGIKQERSRGFRMQLVGPVRSLALQRALVPNTIESGLLRLPRSSDKLNSWAMGLMTGCARSQSTGGGGANAAKDNTSSATVNVLLHLRVEKLILHNGLRATQACLPSLAAILVSKAQTLVQLAQRRHASNRAAAATSVCTLVTTDIDAHGSATMPNRYQGPAMAQLHKALMHRLGSSASALGAGSNQLSAVGGVLALARWWPHALVRIGTGAFSGWLGAEFGRGAAEHSNLTTAARVQLHSNGQPLRTKGGACVKGKLTRTGDLRIPVYDATPSEKQK